jgi:Tol biopolymer transport system component/DNA-binding winged helix-turn-helix (wHTH) protein
MAAGKPAFMSIQFGPFELIAEAAELRKYGIRIKLQDQSLRVLTVLVERAGELVSKEELRQRLWPSDTFVDFDHGLHSAVTRLREALGDSSENRRYIETVPRRGYRFIAPVRLIGHGAHSEHPSHENASCWPSFGTVSKTLGDSPMDHPDIGTVAGRDYQFVVPVAEAPISTPVADQALTRVRPEPQSFLGANLWLAFGVAGIAIIILTGGIALWLAHDREPTPEARPASRFTSDPGVATMPAFSPDGKQIAYVRSEHDPLGGLHFWRRQVGQASIYTKLIGAATELRLTHHPGADYYPAWSPDGQYIAFYRDAPGASGLYLVSALGGPERRITREEAEISGIVWLRDGHQLVVSHAAEGSRSSPLLEVSLDTGQQRPITVPPAGSLGDTWPALSPDAGKLAFIRFHDTATVDVCFISSAGSGLHCWPLQANWPEGVAWTPSGDGLIISAMRTAGHRLWRYDLKGTAPVPLTSGEEEALLPAVSREGDRLAYVLSRRTVNLRELELGPVGLVHSAGAPIAPSTRWQSDPAFSPDGRRIAFLSDRSGSQEIWITDTETQAPTQLTHFGGPPTGSPSWSPDGQQIAFDSEQGGTAIFVIPANGGVPRRITAKRGDNCVPSWSRDGRHVYFASSRSGQFEIWMVLASTGETPDNPAVQITHGGGFRGMESLDSQYLYYAKGRGKPGLCRLKLSHQSDSQEEPVLESLQDWGWWALGPAVIYFLELPRSLPRRVHLKALDLPEGGTRELAMLPYQVLVATPAIAASPDGRHLVYTQIDSMEDNLMLVENFR